MPIPPILWMVAVLYGLQVLVVGAHGLRGRMGLIPLASLLAALVFFMMFTDSLSPRLGADYSLGPRIPLRLSVNSLTIFPVILMGLLLVHLSDGVKQMWILALSLVMVYVLLWGSTIYLGLWNRWIEAGALSVSAMPNPELLPGAWDLARSAIALMLDVLVMVGLHSLLRYGLPQLPCGVIFGIALATGLITDAVVYPLLSLNIERIVSDLLGHVLGKTAVAVLMTVPMITHISRIAARCGDAAPAPQTASA